MKNVLIFFVALLFSSQAYAEKSVRLMTEEFIPYQFHEGKGENKALTGISIEIVHEIQKKIGNTDDIQMLPWARALKFLTTKTNSALFSTVRTPAREDKYKWVGPLSKLEMVFFKKSDSDINITSLEDAKKIGKIGVTKNVATHEILSGMGFENLEVMQSGHDAKNLKLLTKGRIDMWASPYFYGIFNAREMGVLGKVEAIPNVIILSGHLYIAFNKETDDAIIRKWQAALDQLVSEGVVDKIIKKYDW